MELLKWIIVGAAVLVSAVLVALLLPHEAPPTRTPPRPPAQPATTGTHAPTAAPNAPEAVASSPATPAPSAAIVVNGTPISTQAFEQAYVELIDNYTRFYEQFGEDFSLRLQGTQGAFYALDLRAQLVDSLVRDALIEAELTQRGIVVPPAELEAAFQTQYNEILTQNGLGEDQADDILRQQGSSLAQFKQELRDQLAASLQRERLVLEVTGEVTVLPTSLLRYVEENAARYLDALAAVPEPTPDDVRAHYEADPGAYLEVHARHILIRIDEGASALEVAAAQARAHEIRARLEGDEDFAEVARQTSEDPVSAGQGGDLGFFGRGQMAPEVEATAFALPVGQLSEPVRSPFGLHLIRVEAQRTPPFEEVAQRVAFALLQQRQQAAFEPLLAAARQGDAQAMGRIKATAEADFIEHRRAELFEVWVGLLIERASVVVNLPLVAAYRLQTQSLDAAISAFEALQAEGAQDDAPIGFYLCQLYPPRLVEAQEKVQTLAAQPSPSEEQTRQLDALRARLPLYEAQVARCNQG